MERTEKEAVSHFGLHNRADEDQTHQRANDAGLPLLRLGLEQVFLIPPAEALLFVISPIP